MIETHVVNALLKTSLREGTFFSVLNFINGLVAPSFLFCAGLAFAITIRKRGEEFLGLQPSFWRSVIRLLVILAVGYSLHLPFFSFSRVIHETDAQGWNLFFQADILQVIAVTILFLQFLYVITRNNKVFLWITGIAATALVFASPVIRETEFASLPLWLRPYLTAQVMSPFPLFPWSAFLIFGILTGIWFFRVKESLSEPTAAKTVSVLAFIAIVVALFWEIIPVTLYPHHDFWDASPEFFFVRLGIVTLLLTGLWRLEHSHQGEPTTSRSLILTFGRESLLVYVAHLLIVYGQDYEWSLFKHYGNTLNYLQCFGVFAALTAAMGVLAFGWQFLKKWNARAASILQFALLAGITLRFLLK